MKTVLIIVWLGTLAGALFQAAMTATTTAAVSTMLLLVGWILVDIRDALQRAPQPQRNAPPIVAPAMQPVLRDKEKQEDSELTSMYYGRNRGVSAPPD